MAKRRPEHIRWDLQDPRFLRAQAIAARGDDAESEELHALLRDLVGAQEAHVRHAELGESSPLELDPAVLIETLRQLGSAAAVADELGLPLRFVQRRLARALGRRSPGARRRRIGCAA